MSRSRSLTGAVLVLGPLLAVVTLLLTPGDGPAPSTAAPTPNLRGGPAPVVDPVARRLLDRAASAPARTTYHGVAFRSAWTSHGTTSEVVEIDHAPQRGTTVTTAGSPSSAGHRSAVLEVPRPSIAQGGATGLLAAHYALAVVGEDRVAGRLADIVAARRPDAPVAAPDAARLWLDRGTGLVLRREVYDDQGRPVRASAFVQLSIDAAAATGAPGAGSGDRAWPVSIDPAGLARMRAEGWDCPDTLPGPLTLVDARRGGVGGDTLHLSYGDGIASLSVFVAPGPLAGSGPPGHRREFRDGQELWVRDGTPRHLVWASGPSVYTVVADAPERTVNRVVAALPHRPAEGDTLGRLDRGLGRVASWFNPFGVGK